MRRMDARWLGGLVLTALAACGADQQHATAPLPPVAEVLVRPAQLTLQAGGEGLLQAQANDVNGIPVGGAPLVFASSQPQLVSVSQNGVVVSSGQLTETTMVSVTSGRVSAQIPVRVVAGDARRLERIGTAAPQAVAGQSSNCGLIVRAVDAFGNPVAGLELALRDADAQVLVAGFRTDATGQAIVPEFVLKHAGSSSVQVRPAQGDGPVLPVEVGVSAAAPTALRLSLADDADGRAHGAVLVEANDAYGNAVPDTPLIVKLNGVPLGQNLRTDSDGRLRVTPPASRNKARARHLQAGLAADPKITAAMDLPRG